MFKDTTAHTKWELACDGKALIKQVKTKFRTMLADAAASTRKSVVDWNASSLSDRGFVAVFKQGGLSRTNAHAWLYRNFNDILKNKSFTWDPVEQDVPSASGLAAEPAAQLATAAADDSEPPEAAEQSDTQPAVQPAASTSPDSAVAAELALYPGSVSLKVCGPPQSTCVSIPMNTYTFTNT
jgi:hypothetical protein